MEETLTRVASLPDHVLDNQELLEGFALEAFEQAAAANLPALFSEATYKKRPELLEGGVNATWVMLPLRRPRYKRCSRTFNVTITPQMAEAVESFENTPLSDYLQDQLGLPEGEDVEAEIHLFEVLPGGTAADIARNESETPGLGAADEVTLSQLQPLTHEAAGVLPGRSRVSAGRLRPDSGMFVRSRLGNESSTWSLGRTAGDRRRTGGTAPCSPAGARQRRFSTPPSDRGARVGFPERGESSAARGPSPPAVAHRIAGGWLSPKLLGRRLPPILHGKSAAPVAHRASRALRPARSAAQVARPAPGDRAPGLHREDAGMAGRERSRSSPRPRPRSFSLPRRLRRTASR